VGGGEGRRVVTSCSKWRVRQHGCIEINGHRRALTVGRA
jgi:hypothetical protein